MAKQNHFQRLGSHHWKLAHLNSAIDLSVSEKISAIPQVSLSPDGSMATAVRMLLSGAIFSIQSTSASSSTAYMIFKSSNAYTVVIHL